MLKQNTKIPKKSPNSSIFLSDEDDDIDQFRKLEEAVQQDSSDDSDLFLNPDRLKKKFPNLFNESNNVSHKISSSSSFDDNDAIVKERGKAHPDNTEQILQLTNDLHQAFKLVTQKKAELEKEQQKFLKEKKMFAKEKAKYESEQIFADTEAGSSTSYMLLNQKYKALKDKYKFKKSEWQNEKQQYINQINMLNAKLNELKSQKNYSPNRTNSIAHIDISSDSESPDELEGIKSKISYRNQNNENVNAVNNVKDNLFNLVNISPTMESKYSQNKLNLISSNPDENSGNKKDFKKLFSDGSENESETEQFNIIEDNSINYKNNNAYTSANTNNIQIKNTQLKIQNQPNQQIDTNSRQISPQIPASLKSFANEPSVSIVQQDSPQIEKPSNKVPDFRNWDDYDDSSDSKGDNDDTPQIDKPLVFRAVIPKDSQKSSNSSGLGSSPPLAKKSKISSDIKTKKKNENITKIPKKISPTIKNTKTTIPQKKVTQDNNINENSSNSPDSSPTKPLPTRPPLFNMNINSNESNIVSQKSKPSIANKSSISLGQNIKRNDANPKFSLFENYDVNFNADFGEVIDEKEGANHKKIIKYFDGSTEIAFPNGTRKVTRSNCVYVFYQNGDISQDFNDGARAYKYSNGTIDLTLPNGIILCVFPNGQREKHFLNGDKEIIYPSGETKYLKAANIESNNI